MLRGHKRTILILVVLVLLFAVSPAFAATEEEAGPLEALGINLGFLIAQAVNFLLIFGLLTVVLWRPITNHLDQRAAKIQKGLEDASAAANARRNAEEDAEKIRTEARQEAQKLIEEARGQGESVAKSIENDARREAERIREDARSDARGERDAQLANLRDQVMAISVAMTRRLIGETVDQKKQSQLVEDFFSRVPADAKNLEGEVIVISAMPLTDAEQKRVQKEVGASDVTFEVDPAILGGLVIRAGGRVIDGSVRSNLNEMSSQLA